MTVPNNDRKDRDAVPNEETDVLRRMLNTPPKPHDEMKGKGKPESKKKPKGKRKPAK